MILRAFSVSSSQIDSPDRVSLAADIVAAYVTHNSVRTADLAALISSVHTAIINLGAVTAAPESEAPLPAVSVRKSVTPDFLICLDDGKKFKSLKRHLSSLGMTPDQYRKKWNLPENYPMVASEYAAKRSALAKSIGLGQLLSAARKKKPGRTTKAEAAKAGS